MTRHGLVPLLSAWFALFCPREVQAQGALLWDTNVSNGGAQGGSGNWLGTIFWNNILPGNNVAWVNGSRAVFGGSPGIVTVNGPVTTSGLIFNVNSYAVGGSVSTPITIAGPNGIINISTAGHTGTISAPIAGTAGFSKIGPGTLAFIGSAPNTATGPVIVTDGTLNLGKSAGVTSIAGNMTIGDATGGTGSTIVIQGANEQIADSAIVRIEQDGFWNLETGNRSETIGGLEMDQSSIATGTGMLRVNGDITMFFADVLDNDFPPARISGRLDLGGGTRTFTVHLDSSMVVTAAISNGGITKTGERELTLGGTAPNTYSGTTTVEDGVLVLDKPTGVNAIGGDLVVHGTGMFNAFVSQGADEQIPDTTTVTLRNRSTWNLGGSNHSETIGALVLAGGSVNHSATGISVLTVNGNITKLPGSSTGSGINCRLNLGGVTRVVDVTSGFASDPGLGIGGIISNGGIMKTGNGKLSLAAPASNFTGPIIVNGGVLSAPIVSNSGVAGYLGAGNFLSFDGGTLSITAESGSATDRAVILNTGGGTIEVTKAVCTVAMNAAFSGLGGLTKSGPGTQSLGGTEANAFEGMTRVADGTLHLNKATGVNAVPSALTLGDGAGDASTAIITQGADEQIPNGAVVPILPDGFWNLADGNRSETVAALTLTAGAIATGSGVLTVNGNITSNANAAPATISGNLNLNGGTGIFDIAEGTALIDLDVSAAISNGAAALTKTGAGTLLLRGTNVFNGPVALEEGALLARNGEAIGDSSEVTVADGATLVIENTETIASLAGDGTVELNQASILDLAGSAVTTFSGTISGMGGLRRRGTGTLILPGVPAYTGDTLVDGGILQLGSGFPNGAGSLAVEAPGTLQARGIINQSVNGNGAISAIGTLVIGDSASTSGYVFDGTLHVGAATVTLADSDKARLGVSTTMGGGGRLDALNGILLPAAGTLAVTAGASASINSSFTNHGSVHGPTAASQSLTFLGNVDGSGSYTGTVIFANVFEPGPGPAEASFENVAFSSTGELQVEIGGPAPGTQHDQLTVNGTATLGGALAIAAQPGLAPRSSFTIINKLTPGPLVGSFPARPEGSLFGAAGYQFVITYSGGDGNDLVLSIASALQTWRHQHFGSAANQGIGADTADSDGDGEVNLLEFATGQNPYAATRVTPVLVNNGPLLEFTYTRSIAALGDGITFIPEWSDTLTVSSWSNQGVSEQIVHDNGIIQVVKAAVTFGSTRRFMRLKVTSP